LWCQIDSNGVKQNDNEYFWVKHIPEISVKNSVNLHSS